MLTIGMAYFLAALAASAMFIAAGWRSRYTRGVAAARRRHGMANDPLWADPELDITETEPRADVAGAIRVALERLTPLLSSRSVRVEVAAPFGLLARMKAGLLADVVGELLAAAVNVAPGSRLLLTAATRGERIYIGVTDDAPGQDPAIRMAGIRGLAELVALRGGSLDVDVRPNEGTTMTLRLAAAVEDRLDQEASPLPEAATRAKSGDGVTVLR